MTSLNNRKIIASVDLGTTTTSAFFLPFTYPLYHQISSIILRKASKGVAWAFSDSPEVVSFITFPPSLASVQASSTIAFPNNNPYHNLQYPLWGNEVEPEMVSCSWTKLLFCPDLKQDPELQRFTTSGILHLPDDKSPAQVTTEFLKILYSHIRAQWKARPFDPVDTLPVTWYFSRPEMWPAHSWFEDRIVQNAGFGSRTEDQLLMLSDQEAAAHAVFKLLKPDFQDGDRVMICDLGGGTVVGLLLLQVVSRQRGADTNIIPRI